MGLLAMIRWPLILFAAAIASASATEQYTKQFNIPCGACHVNATGDGVKCLSGVWDKYHVRWLIPPKPLWECSHSPGGKLTDFGNMFVREGHDLK